MLKLTLAVGLILFFIKVNGSPIKLNDKIGDNQEWTYEDVDAWPKIKGSFCGGSFQSPINIDTNAVVSGGHSYLRLVNYDVNLRKMNITNNGHTVLLSFPPDNPVDKLPHIIGGGLSGRYNFHSLHFHWGSDSSKGSEHRLDSKQFSGEMHLVHYNEKYGSLEKATEHKDGLAVLAAFMQASNYDNAALQPLIDSVSRMDENWKLLHSTSLRNFLPTDTDKFYRYSGSLTTPLCNEVVTWTVFETPILISENQLSVFRKILPNNFRPPQELKKRRVEYHSD